MIFIMEWAITTVNKKVGCFSFGLCAKRQLAHGKSLFNYYETHSRKNLHLLRDHHKNLFLFKLIDIFCLSLLPFTKKWGVQIYS